MNIQNRKVANSNAPVLSVLLLSITNIYRDVVPTWKDAEAADMSMARNQSPPSGDYRLWAEVVLDRRPMDCLSVPPVLSPYSVPDLS